MKRTEKKRKIGKGGPLAEKVVRRLGEITPEMVRDWRAAQIETGRVSQTSRAYDLMKSVLKTAVDDSILEKNPCQIRGGSTCRSTGSGTSRAPATRRPARLGLPGGSRTRLGMFTQAVRCYFAI